MVFGKLIDIVWFRLLVVYNCLMTSCLDECRSYTERKNEVRRSSGYKMKRYIKAILHNIQLVKAGGEYLVKVHSEWCRSVTLSIIPTMG
jgi:hypothetical protein